MIYYNDNPVNWNRTSGLSEIERLVKEEILQLKNKYFSDNTMQRVRVIYPHGKPEQKFRVFGVLKLLPIPLKSADGLWRYSASLKGANGYADSHKFVTYSSVYSEKDIEFLWFLMNRCSMLNKLIFVEDLEAEAKKEVESLASDADIRYMIMGNSPIAKDEYLIRQVSEIFGVRDVSKKGINQVKKELYDALVDGEKAGDKFVNYAKFEELTQADVKRKAAFYAKASINDGTVGYKDRAWYLMSGREYSEKLMTINAKDAAYREQLFVDEIVNNPSIRSRLFQAIGQEEYSTPDEFRQIDRQSLLQKCKSLGIKTSPTDKAEELVEKLCGHYGINYTQPQSA